MTQSKQAVVLLNFGGPRNLAEVPDFLFEILKDPYVIQLPFPLWFQSFLAKRIAKKRARVVKEQYSEIGGQSPILDATENQRQQLLKKLGEAGIDIPVYIVHRYIVGSTQATAMQILQDRIESLYLIPMYPHYSWSTSGSSFKLMSTILRRVGYKGTIQVLRSYPNHPLYINALVDRITQTLHFHKLQPQGTLILCSAHGLPQAYVDKGDPYLIELFLTMDELRQRLPEWEFELSFQSRVGPAQWLKPYTDDLIPQLPSKGITNVVFVGVSFVNDHLETLFEIDHTYFELARKSNLMPYRVSAIETQADYIQLLSDKIIVWCQSNQAMGVENVFPPDQRFNRYGRWVLYLCLTLFAILLW